MTDDPIVQRLSELPEHVALNYFWLTIRRGADPLEALRQLGKVLIQRDAAWDARAIRREHEQMPRQKQHQHRQCFVCKTADRSLFFHHIIEVYHGGSNDKRNYVSLCFRDHQVLHPWLKEPAANCSGFESVGSIARRYGG